ncbi:hypothetical protein N865_14770 [Intrasporangium oryzae NRRL B-24470]|uniref:Uncharacterized protein n=1 Tax=Intrasporangium oryzae NRRL B-24470 TaxID=1386089 RepID=W9G6V1_9MICO|nr:hypothetical protein N865_14770 [Intrasporangium oryzae NRRL B-24470]
MYLRLLGVTPVTVAVPPQSCRHWTPSRQRAVAIRRGPGAPHARRAPGRGGRGRSRHERVASPVASVPHQRDVAAAMRSPKNIPSSTSYPLRVNQSHMLRASRSRNSGPCGLPITSTTCGQSMRTSRGLPPRSSRRTL